MKAHWRQDLKELGEMPACSEKISFEEWNTLDFEIMENTPEDFETGEGFNMLIKHPHTEHLLLVCSIDFNFREKK